MKNLIDFILRLTIFCLLLLSSCDEETIVTNPQTNTVNVAGRVTDYFGNPMSNGIQVIINDSIVNPAPDGSFNFKDVITPYDVYVLNNTYMSAFCVKGLTISNPVINGSPVVDVFPRLHIEIPYVPPSGSEAVAIFVDTLTGLHSSFATFWSSNSADIFLDSRALNIAGKIYFLQYTLNNNIITSYTKFGKKSFSSGTPATVTFINSELNPVPSSSTVAGILRAPPNYTGGRTELCINFGNFNNINIRGAIVQTINGNNFSYLVPAGIDPSLKINVVGGTTAPGTTVKMATLNAGINNAVININPVTELITPINGAANVDTNTVFSYTNGLNSGIHCITFTGGIGNPQFIIYTKSLSVSIPNIPVNGYTLGSTVSYIWQTQKFHSINNIDDLFRVNFSLNNYYAEIGISETRNFTTRP